MAEDPDPHVMGDDSAAGRGHHAHHSDLRTGPRHNRVVPAGASAPTDQGDSRSVGGTTIMTVTTAYPVRVDARPDPHLSRWLWLVKWILTISRDSEHPSFERTRS